MPEAQAWARERKLSVDDDLSYMREFEHVTLARMRIAQFKNEGAENAILEAVQLLKRLLKAAEDAGRMGSVIEMLALLALAHEAQGGISAALSSLEHALTLAAPEGFTRVFVDEGPPMARLLYEMLSRDINPDFVRRLLAAFPTDEPQQAGSPPTPAQSGLVEPLSERELEVLQLIAQGLTNHEIASRLFVSQNTGKAHTRNIYGKLDVHNRTQAIARARVLGILPSM